MTDERLRSAKRDAARTTDPADAARLLTEQLRAGSLGRSELRALACRQAPGALLALGDDPDPRLTLLRVGRDALAGRAGPDVDVVPFREGGEELAFLLCLRPPYLVFPLRGGRTLVGRSRDHALHEQGPRLTGRRTVVEATQWRFVCSADAATVEDFHSSNGSRLHSAAGELPGPLEALRLSGSAAGRTGSVVPHTGTTLAVEEGDLLVGCYAAFVFGRRWR